MWSVHTNLGMDGNWDIIQNLFPYNTEEIH